MTFRLLVIFEKNKRVQFLHYTCVLQPVDQTILLPNHLWLKGLRTKRLTSDSSFGLENWNKILASTKIFTHFLHGKIPRESTFVWLWYYSVNSINNSYITEKWA